MWSLSLLASRDEPISRQLKHLGDGQLLNSSQCWVDWSCQCSWYTFSAIISGNMYLMFLGCLLLHILLTSIWLKSPLAHVSIPSIVYSMGCWKGVTISVKAYLCCHGIEIQANKNPKLVLTEACGCITEEKAQGWFWHAGYIWNDWLIDDYCTFWICYETGTPAENEYSWANLCLWKSRWRDKTIASSWTREEETEHDMSTADNKKRPEKMKRNSGNHRQ